MEAEFFPVIEARLRAELQMELVATRVAASESANVSELTEADMIADAASVLGEAELEELEGGEIERQAGAAAGDPTAALIREEPAGDDESDDDQTVAGVVAEVCEEY